VGFGGIVLLVWPRLTEGLGGGFTRGVLATQIACLGWAIGSSFSRRVGSGDENVIASAAVQMLFGGRRSAHCGHGDARVDQADVHAANAGRRRQARMTRQHLS
jgi:hypothetical protein